MPDIHIQRRHQLGLPAARSIAQQWALQLEEKFGAPCTYEAAAQADGTDTLRFSRSGVSGTLLVSAGSFVLDAKLGFLLGAFKDKIEAEIEKNLDALLGSAA